MKEHRSMFIKAGSAGNNLMDATGTQPEPLPVMQRFMNTSKFGRISATLTLMASIICVMLSAACFFVAFGAMG